MTAGIGHRRVIERRYKGTPKAHSTFGRNRKSTTRLAKTRRIFQFHYGVEENGNAPAGADPHGEFVGKNILIERHSIAETTRFRSTGISPVDDEDEEAIRGLLAQSRQKLFSIRK